MSLETENPMQTIRPPRSSRWRDVILAIVLFGCGCLVGGVAVTRVYTHRLASLQQNGIDKQRAFMRLKRGLDLNDQQAERVRGIMAKGMSDLRQIRRSVRPQINETLQRIHSEVAAELDERQKRIWNSRFEKMLERWFPPGPDRDETSPDQ